MFINSLHLHCFFRHFLVLPIFCLFRIKSAEAQIHSYLELKIKIKDSPKQSLYIIKIQSDMDTVAVGEIDSVNSYFYAKIPATEENLYSIRFSKKGILPDMAFAAEKVGINIDLSQPNSTKENLINNITGSISAEEFLKTQYDIAVFNREIYSIMKKIDSVSQVVSKNNLLHKLQNDFNRLSLKKINYISEYINSSNSSVASASAVFSQIYSYENDPKNTFGKETMRVVELAQHRFPNSWYTLNLSRDFQKYKNRIPLFNVQNEQIPFQLPDSRKNMKIIYSKEKTTLIYLWASWVDSFPEDMNLIMNLSKKSPNSFEVTSICFDSDIKIWTDVLSKKNNIMKNWKNLIEINSWQSTMMRNFDIYVLPTFVLLNIKGEVLYSSTSLEDIDEKIKNLTK